MEIEFNTSRLSNPANHQPVKWPDPAAPANDTAPLSSAQALEQSVRNLPLVRPEQVARARELVADVQYPPTEMLERISSLLALHLK